MAAVFSSSKMSKIINMTQTKHYSKAPITEALIDLRIVPLEENSLKVIRDLQPRLSEDYPDCEDMIFAQGQFQQIGSNVTATATQSPLGCRFISSDKKKVFQARLDGFTLSQLEPYENWEALRNEAKRLWELYIEVSQPKSVERVAVRYINRLDLPLDSSHSLDFKDYLRTAPEISDGISQGLSGYFMQLQIPQNDLDAILLLNEAIIPPSQDRIVSVLLDIDLSRVASFPIDNDNYWKLLDEFRSRKNEVFEACITDKLRELLA
jgi:uncharacterized protein (TIGR04255 family)